MVDLKVSRTNAIREFMRSRIRVLVENLRAASTVTHAGTVGVLRETYLRNFLADLIPPRYSITSGFVTDPVGNLSPQLDFIVYDRTSLPPILFPTDIAIVPVDSAVVVAEVKSNLDSTAFEQVKRQRSSLNEMYHTMGLEAGARFILPHVVLAFETSIGPDRAVEWLKEAKDLLSVCVINSFAVDRFEDLSYERTLPSERDEHLHVLTFVFRLLNLLSQVVVMRRGTQPRLQEYLLAGY